MERNFGLSEAEPRKHAAHEAVPLRHRLERVKDLAVDQSEIADIAWDVDRGKAAEQFVENSGGPAFKLGFAFARQSARVNDVITLFPSRNHVADNFRRILEIGVHYDDGFASAHIHTGGDRDLVAEIPRQLDVTIAVIAFRFRLKHNRAAVGATVVDKNGFRRPSSPSNSASRRRSRIGSTASSLKMGMTMLY